MGELSGFKLGSITRALLLEQLKHSKSLFHKGADLIRVNPLYEAVEDQLVATPFGTDPSLLLEVRKH